jgi:nucleotide-binding universal stress UspA family protein
MDPKNILIAVDASDNAVRAVDYAATMLGHTPGVRVTLLYVERAPGRDLFDTEEAWLSQCRLEHERVFGFLKDARARLAAAGIQQAAMAERTVLCSAEPSIAQTIMEVQQEGGFGTLVVGRRGITKGEEFLFGSVSTKLVHNARDCAVWVVQ